jgi:hypothetical protein
MPPAHFPLELVRDLPGGELVPLFGDHQLERQVKQKVAQFASDLGGLAVAEGVVQLERLLDQVRPQRFSGLGPVPGAPPAEVTDHRQSASKR